MSAKRSIAEVRDRAVGLTTLRLKCPWNRLRGLHSGIVVLGMPGALPQWRALPKDLPPKSTVHDYVMLGDWDGTLERVHHALYLMTRDGEGREARPSNYPLRHCGASARGLLSAVQ